MKFNKHDIWIGVYWKDWYGWNSWLRTIYICIIPCFPIEITWELK